MSDLRIRVIPALGDIAAEAWDACANPRASTSTSARNRLSLLANCAEAESDSQPHDPASLAPRHPLDSPLQAVEAMSRAPSDCRDQVFNPFISHAFLCALEASGSAVARAGWQPQHLVA